jgi:hypothetical protein
VLYDVTSILPYENERHARLAMKIGDGYELVAYRNPWPATAARLGLDSDWVTARAAELCARAPGVFAEAAEGRPRSSPSTALRPASRGSGRETRRKVRQAR